MSAENNQFTFSSLNPALIQAVEKLGYNQATAIQQQAIPLILNQHDVLVSAETGSGKTAAFLLPVLHHLLSNTGNTRNTRVLILTPTRELAQQVYEQASKLAEFTEIKIGLIIGGEDFKKQQHSLRQHNAVLIATPGRLIELITANSHDFSQLNCLILDEADRMLDMGFAEDVLHIAQECNPARQNLLFSATLNHHGVARMARKILRDDYETIALNSLHSVHSQITQEMLVVDDAEHKLQLVTWLLQNETFDKALIFSNMKTRVIVLHDALRGKGLRVNLLHGDLDQKDRTRIMRLFHEGVFKTLIVTDIAARGLDIKGVDLVINYDVPRNGVDYIHRIGRTGRADNTGKAITLVNHNEWNTAAGIQRFLKQEFTLRKIKELAGTYQGPKKVKKSGESAGKKTKEAEVKKEKKPKVKIRERDKKNIGKRRVPTAQKIISTEESN